MKDKSLKFIEFWAKLELYRKTFLNNFQSFKNSSFLFVTILYNPNFLYSAVTIYSFFYFWFLNFNRHYFFSSEFHCFEVAINIFQYKWYIFGMLWLKLTRRLNVLGFVNIFGHIFVVPEMYFRHRCIYQFTNILIMIICCT